MNCPTCDKPIGSKTWVRWLDTDTMYCSRGCLPLHPRPIVNGKVTNVSTVRHGQ
jgi:hypothetical protein